MRCTPADSTAGAAAACFCAMRARRRPPFCGVVWACALAAVLMTPPAHAQLRGLGPFAQLRDTAAALRAGVQRLADVPYGADPLQRMDVYLPAAGSAASSAAVASGTRAPVIFMVHGGAWRTGDKAMSRVVQE